MNVAFWIHGAPMLDILHPSELGGQSPVLAGAVGAEINGGFVSLSKSLYPRPWLVVEKKGEE